MIEMGRLHYMGSELLFLDFLHGAKLVVAGLGILYYLDGKSAGPTVFKIKGRAPLLQKYYTTDNGLTATAAMF